MVSNSDKKIGMEEEIIVYNSNQQRLPVNSGKNFSANDFGDRK